MSSPSSKPTARATSDNGFSTVVPSDSSPSTARHKPAPGNVTTSGWQPAQEDFVEQEEQLKLKQELEKLKVATMHSMVDRVACDVEDNPVDLRCLYLTNVQASEVPIQSMPKVRQELGIKEPKMVIRLMPSHFGSTYWQTFANWTAGPEGGRFPTKSIPELSDEAQDATEHQLMLLAKDVLLPLASRTCALVIGSESCALTAAFVKVSAPTERQMGDACPFRLLIFARAYFFHVKSLKQGTTAYQVRQACKAWMQADFAQPLTRMFGEDEAFWPCEDFSTGKYSLIMFDCLGPSGLAHETANNFQNDFISSLSQELPVIALQTYGTNKMNMVPALAEHVTRGLPLMLLDSRPRPPPKNLDQAAHELLCFSEELHNCQRRPGGPRADQYFTSVLAFIKGTLDGRRKAQPGPLKRMTKDAFIGMDEELPDHRLWIHEAIQRRLSEDGANERSNAETKRGRAALEEDHDLMNATELVMSYTGGELEWESWALQQRCGHGIDVVMAAQTWEEFAQRLDENWLRIRSCCFHSFQNARVFAAENHWIVLDEHRRQSPKGTKILRIILDSPDVSYTPQSLDEAKRRLGKLLGDSLQVSKDYDQKTKTRQIFMSNEAMWLAVYDILKAGNVHAGNLHHLAQVNGTLFSLAQIDRLPSQNTLEALVLLRTAWTTVDVYNSRAATYKIYAKAVYFMTLLLGLTTVSFTVLCKIYPNAVAAQQQAHVLLAFALFGTLLTGYAALVDPARKWLQLRNGAFSLEAEIWKFRTRVGDYQGSQASATYHGRMIEERRAEEMLQSAILRVQGRVRLSTGLKETGFYAVPMATNDLRKVEEEGMIARTTSALNVLLRKASVTTVPPSETTRRFTRAHYQHGQYRSAASKPLPKGQDSHHAPARPEDYTRFRLAPKLQFYQQRIPRYAVRRRLYQGLLLLSSLGTSLLAALGKPNWTAIVAAFSGAVAGWQEFVDVAKKLQRYSTTSASLSNILSWWQKLTEVEQASVKNISLLVARTEGLLSDERCAWVSDAQQTLRLVNSEGRREGSAPAKAAPET